MASVSVPRSECPTLGEITNDYFDSPKSGGGR